MPMAPRPSVETMGPFLPSERIGSFLVALEKRRTAPLHRHSQGARISLSLREPGSRGTARMYLISVILLMFVLPAASVAVDALVAQAGVESLSIILIGKWYVFWAAGARLFIAGWRQIIQP